MQPINSPSKQPGRFRLFSAFLLAIATLYCGPAYAANEAAAKAAYQNAQMQYQDGNIDGAIAELNKALAAQKDYLSKYNQMLMERKNTVEAEFSEFLNQISGLKDKTNPSPDENANKAIPQYSDEPPSEKVRFFSLSFPTFKKLLK